jgi:hypothetical protein|tara:strand:- start:68 stop:220 length:153 start_codon:yes stop_codon:yes gene_type:complete
MRWIDSYEKALVFWLAMVGLAFLSIAIGMQIGDFITTFVQPKEAQNIINT